MFTVSLHIPIYNVCMYVYHMQYVDHTYLHIAYTYIHTYICIYIHEKYITSQMYIHTYIMQNHTHTHTHIHTYIYVMLCRFNYWKKHQNTPNSENGTENQKANKGIWTNPTFMQFLFHISFTNSIYSLKLYIYD